MAKPNELRGRAVNVDLIRTIAMIGVITVHAAGRFTITSQQLSQMTPAAFTQWSVVDLYQSVAVPLGVPLFLMLSGALLLQPVKADESLRVFFRKRWARIGLPSIFWGIAYFAWDFTVVKIPFSWAAIVQGILNGPYTQMWYLYVLVGLYFITPFLRIIIAHADVSLIQFFILLWVVGVSILPFFGLFTIFALNENVFVVSGYVGFFVLGTYLSTVEIRRRTLAFFIAFGVGLTAVGTYALAVTDGAAKMYFFQEYFSPTIILVSVMVFLLLFTMKPPAPQEATSQTGKTNKLVKLISANTLGIFFIHVMIIESIEYGYLGFAINRYVLNPIIEVPLLTAIVLFASLGIILLLKKIPPLRRWID